MTSPRWSIDRFELVMLDSRTQTWRCIQEDLDRRDNDTYDRKNELYQERVQDLLESLRSYYQAITNKNESLFRSPERVSREAKEPPDGEVKHSTHAGTHSASAADPNNSLLPVEKILERIFRAMGERLVSKEKVTEATKLLSQYKQNLKLESITDGCIGEISKIFDLIAEYAPQVVSHGKPQPRSEPPVGVDPIKRTSALDLISVLRWQRDWDIWGLSRGKDNGESDDSAAGRAALWNAMVSSPYFVYSVGRNFKKFDTKNFVDHFLGYPTPLSIYARAGASEFLVRDVEYFSLCHTPSDREMISYWMFATIYEAFIGGLRPESSGDTEWIVAMPVTAGGHLHFLQISISAMGDDASSATIEQLFDEWADLHGRDETESHLQLDTVRSAIREVLVDARSTAFYTSVIQDLRRRDESDVEKKALTSGADSAFYEMIMSHVHILANVHAIHLNDKICWMHRPKDGEVPTFDLEWSAKEEAAPTGEHLARRRVINLPTSSINQPPCTLLFRADAPVSAEDDLIADINAHRVRAAIDEIAAQRQALSSLSEELQAAVVEFQKKFAKSITWRSTRVG